MGRILIKTQRAHQAGRGDRKGRWCKSEWQDSAHDPGLSASLPDPPLVPPLPDPSPFLSRHAAEGQPFKGGVECWDPKSLRFLATEN